MKYKKKIFCYKNFKPFTKVKDLCSYFKLDSLEIRSPQSDMMFLRDILSGYIYCADLLNSISLSVPSYSTRKRQLYKLLLFYKLNNFNTWHESRLICEKPNSKIA